MALAAIGIGVVFLVIRPQQDPSGIDGSAPSTGEVPSSEAAAAALARLESDPATLVPMHDLDELGGRVREAIPVGSTVEVDPTTWAPDGIGGGVMQVQITQPGQAPQTYLAVMAQEDGEWKVLATLPIG
ncbi:hypothetical protein [Rhodococcus zopfii]|uniref:hypothetical protein n=1 Tax=Rhodococcus zopfii TaxID=43772 RepID=UPI001EDFD72D|nr:hypothetical protein [Rhodococcus zopfii]